MALAAACSEASGPGGDIVALVVQLPPTGVVEVEEEDTVRIAAWALTRQGDSVSPGITWRELAPRGVVALDTVSGEIVGLLANDTTTVQARFGPLRSDPVRVRVTAAADSLRATGVTTDTVAAADSLSAPLVVELVDTTSEPGVARPLGGRPVRFTVPESAVGRLVQAPDSTGVTLLTATTGRASVTLKRQPGATGPDSVIVEATAERGTGAPVPGSPIRFVVHFL